MKHTWQAQPDERWLGICNNVKVKNCTTCGCISYTAFSYSEYVRNGQVYTHPIDCVNMEVENLKTID